MSLKKYVDVLKNEEDKNTKIKRRNNSKDVLDQSDTVSLEDILEKEESLVGDESYD